MSENSLFDIVSTLSQNKEFNEMVQKVKESGDFSSILGDVASLLGGMDEKALEKKNSPPFTQPSDDNDSRNNGDNDVMHNSDENDVTHNSGENNFTLDINKSNASSDSGENNVAIDNGSKADIFGKKSDILSDEQSKESGEVGAFSEATELLSGILGGSKASDKDGGGKEESTTPFSAFGGFLPFFVSGVSKSSSLLIALKPYLSKKRCDLIDSLIKLSRLAAIVSLTK